MVTDATSWQYYTQYTSPPVIQNRHQCEVLALLPNVKGTSKGQLVTILEGLFALRFYGPVHPLESCRV